MALIRSFSPDISQRGRAKLLLRPNSRRRGSAALPFRVWHVPPRGNIRVRELNVYELARNQAREVFLFNKMIDRADAFCKPPNPLSKP